MTQQCISHPMLTSRTYGHWATTMVVLNHVNEWKWLYGIQEHLLRRSCLLGGQLVRIQLNLVLINNKLSDAPRGRSVESHHGIEIIVHIVFGQHLMPGLAVRGFCIQYGSIHIKDQTLVEIVNLVLLLTIKTGNYFSAKSVESRILSGSIKGDRQRTEEIIGGLAGQKSKKLAGASFFTMSQDPNKTVVSATSSKYGAPRKIRTSDRSVRSRVLYPAELWVQSCLLLFFIRCGKSRDKEWCTQEDYSAIASPYGPLLKQRYLPLC